MNYVVQKEYGAFNIDVTQINLISEALSLDVQKHSSTIGIKMTPSI
jgi:hypothetical protein